MGSLLRTPVSYGFRDLSFTTKKEHRLRVYFPSRFSRFSKAGPALGRILPGDYSLIVFVHGNRSSSPEMCPPDLSKDYTRWGSVLHLWARCGFVVAVPDVHQTIGLNSEGAATTETADDVTEVMHWMYEEWQHRDMLLNVLGTPSYRMGLAGHSWGALVCARLAGNRHFGPRAIATISGTWASEISKQELAQAAVPTLFVSGTNEASLFAQPGFQPYPEVGLPKHQMALQKGKHWDWFPPGQDIYPCNGAPQNRCGVGWRAASELCLTFFTKYLYNQGFLQPYLLTSPGSDRPNLLDSFQEGSGCAMKIRWLTAETDDGGRFRPTDETTIGPWTEGEPW